MNLSEICVNIAMFYMAIQKWRGNVAMGSNLTDNGWKWKTSLGLLNLGVVGMTIAMLVAGYQQAFIERATEGSTWSGFFKAQTDPTFLLSMDWRMIFGWITALGLVILIWDLVTIGRYSPNEAAGASTDKKLERPKNVYPTDRSSMGG